MSWNLNPVTDFTWVGPGDESRDVVFTFPVQSGEKSSFTKFIEVICAFAL